MKAGLLIVGFCMSITIAANAGVGGKTCKELEPALNVNTSGTHVLNSDKDYINLYEKMALSYSRENIISWVEGFVTGLTTARVIPPGWQGQRTAEEILNLIKGECSKDSNQQLGFLVFKLVVPAANRSGN